jgi:adenylate cyclase
MLYSFTPFILDTDRFELRKDQQLLAVEPQVIELLILLVENRDRMIAKEEILERIWPGRVISEAALSSRIKSARQALGDDGRNQLFIRTIHKKGFRFVAELDDPLASASHSPSTTNKHHADVEHMAKPAVAVLPFNNLSDQQEQEYFSDGITTDIITRLAKHRWLNVISRNSTFGYKNRSLDMRALGKELAANYIIEGTVQRSGNRVRVSCNLIDTSNGHQKWSERFDREIADIFSLQDEITEKIVARLEPEIGFAERNKAVHSRPPNLEAWDCYHLAIYHIYRFTGPDNLEAQKLLLQSQQRDDHFGEAFAWWAYAIVLGMVYWDTPPSQQLLDDALAACDKALSLDGQNAVFYALRARVLLARREYQAAIAENEMAISLNPTLAVGFCGLADSLAYEGRYQEALEYFDRAITLSPNDPQLWAFLTYGALAQIFNGDYLAALQWTERASSIPNYQYWTTAHRVVALSYLGRLDEAQRWVEKLLIENPAFSLSFAREKLFYLKKQDQIECYLKGLEMAGVPG